jgi:hypothetical protein
MYGHNNPTVRTTDDGEQVGPKMHSAVINADCKTWQSKKELAEHVGPNGSTDYGYRIVERCIRKGLISRPDPEHDNANPHGQGAIHITDKGKDYLNNHGDN